MSRFFLVCFTLVILFNLVRFSFPQVSFAAPSEMVMSKVKDAVVLIINSNNSLVKGQIKKIDTDESVKPFIENGRTLVPLRFISENFGAKVSYEQKTKMITIVYNEKKINFFVDSKKYIIDDKEQADLEVETKIVAGRTLIPLRALVTAMGKEVFWDERGIIVISDVKDIFNLATDDEMIDQLLGYINPVKDTVNTGNINNSLPFKVEDTEKVKTELMEYKSEGNIKAKVYYPLDWKNTDSRPVVLFIHGGGWSGDNFDQFKIHSQYFALRGIVAITATHRLIGRDKVKVDVCIEDVADAVKWVRNNAEKLGIDKDKVVVAGGSSGGQLSLSTELFGEDPLQKPNLLVLFNPAINIDSIKFKPIFQTQEVIEKYDTIAHIKSNMPPQLILHGEIDPLVPLDYIQKYIDACKALNNDCELVVYKDASHSFFNLDKAAAKGRLDHFYKPLEDMDKFLQKHKYITAINDLDLSGFIPLGTNVAPTTETKEGQTTNIDNNQFSTVAGDVNLPPLPATNGAAFKLYYNSNIDPKSITLVKKDSPQNLTFTQESNYIVFRFPQTTLIKEGAIGSKSSIVFTLKTILGETKTYVASFVKTTTTGGRWTLVEQN